VRKILDFLDRLEAANIFYRLDHVRDSIMILIAVPGERWEVEFFDDGGVDVEVFRSAGDISHDSSVLDELIATHQD
jgi:hypothetical protein